MVVALLLFLLRCCSSLENYVGNSKISVTIYANTLFEVDGISSVPSVFGITAYNGATDFALESGSHFLAAHNIDTVGLGTTLSSLLPTGQSSLSTSSLQEWFSMGNAYSMYKRTANYFTLRSRGIWKGGARPFLFIRNIQGTCNPFCQKVNCWSGGGTPKAKTSSGFKWWTTLITGYLKLALKADPRIDTVHIWNEPDTTFWKDGKNGSYYASLYVSTAQAIKTIWPNLKIGGPVSSAPSTDLLRTRKHSLLLWFTYIQPLIDTAVPLELLDFIDFHAFGSSTSPEALLNAIETTVSYTLVKHNTFIPVAITESSIKSNYNFDQGDSKYFLNRTLPLMISTFALLRCPGKVIHRLLFDYKGTSKCKGCKFAGQSPEAFMYQLLGKLANGSRLHLTIDGGQYMTSSCVCFTSTSLGGQPIIGEAAIVNENVTFALLNTCDCPITIKLSLVGVTNSAVKSSWAALQDYSGVTIVTPMSWSSSTQSLTLPSHSLYVSTYQFSTRYSTFSSSQANSYTFYKRHQLPQQTGKRFPIRIDYVHQAITSYPTKTKYIMMAIPLPVPCNYMFTMEYNVESAMYYQPNEVKLRLGFIGNPGFINWSATWKCSRYYNSLGSRNWLQIISPGQYYEGSLSCVPKVRSNGCVRLYFKAANKCQSLEGSSSSSSVGYLAFSSLVYISQTALY